MKTFSKNPVNPLNKFYNRHLLKRVMYRHLYSLVIMLIMVLTMALIFACSSDDDKDSGGGSGDNPFSNVVGYEDYAEWLKYYDPDEDRCQNGVVERKCEVDGNDVWYSPLTHRCYEEEGRVCALGADCGGSESSGGLETIEFERCGSKSYIPDEYLRCRNGIVERKCEKTYDANEVWYNYETHYCDEVPPVIARERCGNKYYTPIEDWERCQNGVVENLCGNSYYGNGIWYNRITQSCDWETDTVKNKVKCGS